MQHVQSQESRGLFNMFTPISHLCEFYILVKCCSTWHLTHKNINAIIRYHIWVLSHCHFATLNFQSNLENVVQVGNRHNEWQLKAPHVNGVKMMANLYKKQVIITEHHSSFNCRDHWGVELLMSVGVYWFCSLPISFLDLQSRILKAVDWTDKVWRARLLVLWVGHAGSIKPGFPSLPGEGPGRAKASQTSAPV